jgi:hypothetical protein
LLKQRIIDMMNLAEGSDTMDIVGAILGSTDKEHRRLIWTIAKDYMTASTLIPIVSKKGSSDTNMSTEWFF